MKRYRVILHPEAEADIASSYEWGSRVWGEKRAKGWVRDLQRTIRSRLTSLPLSCPLAQESADLDREVRQVVVQRYRVLFVVERKTVTILHVRGPYVGQVDVSEPGQA
jgi:plasmid stabilization system protein ParE